MHIYRKDQKGTGANVTVGDVVLIKDDDPTPSSKWRLRKVLQLVFGRDGQVRGAELRVISKGRQQTKIFRPLQKMVPFEIVEADENTEFTAIRRQGNSVIHGNASVKAEDEPSINKENA